jgi:hypothetical protein
MLTEPLAVRLAPPGYVDAVQTNRCRRWLW